MKRLFGRLVEELLHQKGSACFSRYRQALYERLDYLSLSESASTLSTLLVDAMNEEDTQLRFRAAEILKRSGQPLPDDFNDTTSDSAVPILRGISDNSSSTTFAILAPETEERMRRLLSMGRAGQVPPEGIIELLRVLHEDGDSVIKQAAIWSLGRVGQIAAEGIIALIDALQDDDPHIRNTTAASLGALGLRSPEATKALLLALQDTDARVREEAIRSLGKLRQMLPEVVQALYGILHQDADSEVRYVASVNLGTLNHLTPDVVATMVQALKDARSWSIRRASARLLSKVNRIDEGIVESLLSGLLDEDNDVRTACVEGLAVLERRFPDIAVTIGSKFVQAIEDPIYEKTDNKSLSAREYAFNGLWLMVVSGDVVAERY
jgi:HEAT repeat protein